MKTFIINGSPNPGGMTSRVLDEFEKGLKEAGSDVTRKNISEQKIGPCRGCFSCWSGTPGECVIKDDMETLRQLVADADLFVIATPVYVDGMTGPTKTFLDRLIPLIMGRVELRDDHMRHLVREKVKRGGLALISVSGFTELDNFDPLVMHLKAASKNLGREYAGELLIPSGWFIHHDKEAWEKVVHMINSSGEDLVKKGRINEELSEKISKLVSRDTVVKYMNIGYGKYE